MLALMIQGATVTVPDLQALGLGSSVDIAAVMKCFSIKRMLKDLGAEDHELIWAQTLNRLSLLATRYGVHVDESHEAPQTHTIWSSMGW